MNEHQPTDPPNVSNEASNHAVVTGVGAASGGITGAAIGHAIAGKVGAVVGGVTGAIAGGMPGSAIAPALQSSIAGLTGEVIQETSLSLGLGADTKAIELPAHYSWEELQALSKPQPEA